MALAEYLDTQETQTTGKKQGTGQLPNTLLTRIAALGVGRDWTITVQEFGTGLIQVQFQFRTPPPAT